MKRSHDTPPPRRILRTALAALALACTALGTQTLPAAADELATPPAQPASGPGGSGYAYSDMTVSQGGRGNEAWYVFQPSGGPALQSAPVAVILHGYGEYSGYDTMYALIRHTVRKGTIVVYPRWQTCLFCPLPNMESPIKAATEGIKGGLAWLSADPATRIQPQLDKASYFGFSYGGMIALNLANRHSSLGLPTPRALMVDEPHGGQVGDQIDASLSGIPAATKVSCVVSDEYAAVNSTHGCYKAFPRLSHLPAGGKDFIVVPSDTHGTPDLIATHGMSNGLSTGERVDSIDYFAIWKTWDGLRSCALTATDCSYGLNDTPEHRFMGLWSDGTPVTELSIADVPITS